MQCNIFYTFYLFFKWIYFSLLDQYFSFLFWKVSKYVTTVSSTLNDLQRKSTPPSRLGAALDLNALLCVDWCSSFSQKHSIKLIVGNCYLVEACGFFYLKKTTGEVSMCVFWKRQTHLYCFPQWLKFWTLGSSWLR